MSGADPTAGRRLALVGDELERARLAARQAGFAVVDERPEIVLCHGGDGTLLRAEREWPGVPKVPIRCGRVQPCPEHGLSAVLQRLAAGRLQPTVLPKLAMRSGAQTALALNDVVLRNESPATAVRLRVVHRGATSDEITGDGVVIATPFGSSGYYRSVCRQTFERGFGLAYNNSTEPRAPLHLGDDERLAVEITRGPAVLVCDNEHLTLALDAGDRFEVERSPQTTVVLGLDALGCHECRRTDGSSYNPH